MAETKTVITLICERAADLHEITNKEGDCTSVPGVKVIKLPCSGMIQPLMIEAAMKAGADGVIVCGCQIGDCYYREGNRMIRDRLLGDRMPGLKKTVDRKRVMALWLSRLQKGKFESEAKEFIIHLDKLGPAADAKPAAAAAPAAKTGAENAAAAKEKAAAPTAKDAMKAKEETAKEAAPDKPETAKDKAEEKKEAKAEEKDVKDKDAKEAEKPAAEAPAEKDEKGKKEKKADEDKK